MLDDDEIRLRHMLKAAREAPSFTQQRARADLDADRQLVLSLVKDIEIIGEAANGTAETTRQRLPEPVSVAAERQLPAASRQVGDGALRDHSASSARSMRMASRTASTVTSTSAPSMTPDT